MSSSLFPDSWQKNFSRAVLLATILSILFTGSASATRVERLTLAQLRDKATAVVLGKVVGITTHVGLQGAVWTDYQLQIVETLKGEDHGAETVVSFAGEVAGMPVLTWGETYLLFLRYKEPYAVPTVGWGQGIFKMIDIADDGYNRTALVSDDGEPLLRTAAGKLRRGGRVEIVNGAVHTPEVSAASRERDPIAVQPDGVESTLPHWAPRALSPPSPQDFATLEDLRRFLAGLIEEIDRGEQAPRSEH
jgi:hypothetical protein